MRRYFVYRMSNKSRTLYVGITGDLERRVSQHKSRLLEGFSRRYNTTWLVYCEEYFSPREAIAREKQIKGWTRAKKLALVELTNPGWRDLAEAGSRTTGNLSPSERCPRGPNQARRPGDASPRSA